MNYMSSPGGFGSICTFCLISNLPNMYFLQVKSPGLLLKPVFLIQACFYLYNHRMVSVEADFKDHIVLNSLPWGSHIVFENIQSQAKEYTRSSCLTIDCFVFSCWNTSLQRKICNLALNCSISLKQENTGHTFMHEFMYSFDTLGRSLSKWKRCVSLEINTYLFSCCSSFCYFVFLIIVFVPQSTTSPSTNCIFNR